MKQKQLITNSMLTCKQKGVESLKHWKEPRVWKKVAQYDYISTMGSFSQYS